jgi:gas vesicle protein
MADQTPETQDDGSSSALAWFITGAVIGATVALLYTPRSGKDTRRLLGERTQQSRDSLTGTGKNLMDAGKDMFERGRKLIDDASDLFEQGRKLVRG